MNKEQLKQNIESRFNTKRAFVSAFNQAAGFDALNETTLSRQLSGIIEISKFAGTAYNLFFSMRITERELDAIRNNLSRIIRQVELISNRKPQDGISDRLNIIKDAATSIDEQVKAFEL